MSEQMDQNPQDNNTRTFSEQLEVAGSQLVEKVQEIIKQGNVRRVVIRTAEDRVLLDTTLTISAVAGGVLALTAWPLAVLGGIAAAVARVKIEIVRELQDGELLPDDGKRKIEIADEE